MRASLSLWQSRGGSLRRPERACLFSSAQKSQGLLRQTFGTAESRHWRRLKKTFRSDNLHAADVSRWVCRRRRASGQRALVFADAASPPLSEAFALAERCFGARTSSCRRFRRNCRLCGKWQVHSSVPNSKKKTPDSVPSSLRPCLSTAVSCSVSLSLPWTQSTDCQRRKDQLLAGAAASRSAFEGLCGEFEISPETAESAEASALEAQLERHVLRALPSAFGRAQSAIAPHADALVALYRRFALHNGAEGSWAEGDAPLALLLVFAKEGNVSLECLAKRLPSSELLQREVRVLQEEQMLSRDALGIRLEGGGEDAAFSEAQKDREETVAAAETHCADREAKDFPSAESGSLNELRRQLLLRPVCRRQILDDLLELQAFLLVRAQQRHSNRQFSLPDELQSSEAQVKLSLRNERGSCENSTLGWMESFDGG